MFQNILNLIPDFESVQPVSYGFIIAFFFWFCGYSLAAIVRSWKAAVGVGGLERNDDE